MKLHGSWVFSGYLRNIQDEGTKILLQSEKILRFYKKVVDRCVIYVIP
jgi:hypothetical protein